MRFGIFVLSLFFYSISYSQSAYLDSLKSTLQKSVSNDTMRVFQYNEIAWTYLDYSLDSSYFYLQKGLLLAQKKRYANGIMDAKNTLGIYYRLNSRYPEAIKTYEELIQLRKKHKQEEKLIGAYSNLGSVYFEKGSYALALKNYEKSINLAKKLNDFDNQLILYTNIGTAYKSIGLYDQAVQAFQEGLTLNKQIKNEEQDAQLYVNLGTVYHERQMYNQEIKYNLIAKEKVEKSGNYRLLETVLFNLSLDYRYTKQYVKAKKVLNELKKVAQKLNEEDVWLSYYQSEANYLNDIKKYSEALQAAEMAEKMSNKEADLLSFAEVQLTKATIYHHMHKRDLAIKHAEIALDAFNDTEDVNAQVRTYNTLSEIYKKSGNHQKALQYYETANSLKEKMDLEAVTNQISTLNSLNELDRKEQDLALSKQKNQRISAENDRKSNLILGLFLIGGLIVISLGISFKSNQQKRKANALLNQQNEEIETQKTVIEEKQGEILGSIHYAKRIQESLLVKQQLLKEELPASFVFFQPKDIVSGDFYWATKRNSKFYLAICDSTGHGVPGAFMSALNITFLSEAVNQLGIEEPGQIFNHVRNRLVESISHDGAKDGMDGVLLCFDESRSIISYAAAYNTPIIVRNNELIKFSADKMPVGKSDYTQDFQTFSIESEPGDELFVYTDGYADQFGGERGKKFKIANLNTFLMELSNQKISEQSTKLKTHFNAWKGNLEQVDDVCVFGVKLS
ncbi:tetratricopeptide repeat protein [Fluviicola taffensis]|uniref:Protein serine/threonine phosphatase n=1 Tax=Fluviicola taffensis (strain DSM 16823 / NCIMB 13979 / RW262) TaxID=755732 RepID=F2IK09_FLUTR|nr:tetratricopeptide repeat protein [Fluviicola taffensis]AEA42908.1 protein serine/threonine phosphatase [Fluviicola taffensis DSM 16823]